MHDAVLVSARYRRIRRGSCGSAANPHPSRALMRQDVPEIPRSPPDGLPSPEVSSPVAFEKYRVCPAGLRSRTRRPVRAGSLRERHSLGSTPRRMSPPLSRQQSPGEWSSHTGGKYPCLCPSAVLGPATRILLRIEGPRTVRYRHSRADNAQRDAGYRPGLAGSTSVETRCGSPDFSTIGDVVRVS